MSEWIIPGFLPTEDPSDQISFNLPESHWQIDKHNCRFEGYLQNNSWIEIQTTDMYLLPQVAAESNMQ